MYLNIIFHRCNRVVCECSGSAAHDHCAVLDGRGNFNCPDCLQDVHVDNEVAASQLKCVIDHGQQVKAELKAHQQYTLQNEAVQIYNLINGHCLYDILKDGNEAIFWSDLFPEDSDHNIAMTIGNSNHKHFDAILLNKKMITPFCYQMLLDAIIHEIIHALEFQGGYNREGHGYRFKRRVEQLCQQLQQHLPEIKVILQGFQGLTINSRYIKEAVRPRDSRNQGWPTWP